MAIKSEYNKIQPYSTKDGSQIKELMHPNVHGNQRQSLAEACIPIGSGTLLHKHNNSEELYPVEPGKIKAQKVQGLHSKSRMIYLSYEFGRLKKRYKTP